MERHIPLVVVCGPTASGKTGLSIEMAKRLGGEIVSADSMQIYRRMDIGTAKPTREERQGIPHHLMDMVDPGETFSVAQYVTLAKKAVEEIHRRGKLPILVGGTGLYIDSLTRNIQFAEMPQDPGLREKYRGLAEQKGASYLWDMLQDCDPDLAATLHPNNLGRVIRGLETFHLTGKPLSQWQRESRLEPSPYQLCMLGLTFRDREALYNRIDLRVDQMMEQGLAEEVGALLQSGLSATAFQAIGYKEIAAHLRGELSLEDAVDTVKRESRRYAKRQLTWLRRDERICWLLPDGYQDPQQLVDDACRIAIKKGRSAV